MFILFHFILLLFQFPHRSAHLFTSFCRLCCFSIFFLYSHKLASLVYFYFLIFCACFSWLLAPYSCLLLDFNLCLPTAFILRSTCQHAVMPLSSWVLFIIKTTICLPDSVGIWSFFSILFCSNNPTPQKITPVYFESTLSVTDKRPDKVIRSSRHPGCLYRSSHQSIAGWGNQSSLLPPAACIFPSIAIMTSGFTDNLFPEPIFSLIY